MVAQHLNCTMLLTIRCSIVLILAFHGLVSAQTDESPKNLSGAQAFELQFRKEAFVIPCKNFEDPECKLWRQFERNDTDGDDFLKQHLAVVTYISKTNLQQIDKWEAFYKMIEEWIKFYQTRHTVFLAVFCGDNAVQCPALDADTCHIYYNGVLDRSMDYLDLVEQPEILFLNIIRAYYNEPIFPGVQRGEGPIEKEWKEAIEPFLTQRRKSFEDLRFMAITDLKSYTSEKFARLLSLAGISSSHDLLVSEVQRLNGTGLELPIAGAMNGLHIYDLRKSRNCSIDNIPDCKYLRTINLKEITHLTNEEVACNILVTKCDGGIRRQLRIEESKLDQRYLNNVLSLCPLLLVVQGKAISQKAIDASLGEHKKLVVIQVAGPKSKAMTLINKSLNIKKSMGKVQLITRLRYKEPIKRYEIHHDKTEHFFHSLKDKISIHQYETSVQPEATTFSFRGFGLDPSPLVSGETEDLYNSYVDALTEQGQKTGKRKSLTADSFRAARLRKFFIIHFYQPWSIESSVIGIVINEVVKVLKTKYGITRKYISSFNCFDYDEVCHQEGIKVYSTVKAFRYGEGEKLNGTISLTKLLRLILLSIEGPVLEASNEKEFNSITQKFSSLSDNIFVAVDLQKKQKETMSEVVRKFHGKEVFISVSASALPKALREAIPASTTFFAFHPAMMKPHASMKEIKCPGSLKKFIGSAKSNGFAELKWEDLTSMCKNRSLLILFTRELTAPMRNAMMEVSLSSEALGISPRWMNAGQKSALAIMNAYGIKETPALAMKFGNKVFNYADMKIEKSPILRWVHDIMKNKSSPQYKLPVTQNKPKSQFLDFNYAIFQRPVLSTKKDDVDTKGEPGDMVEVDETEEVEVEEETDEYPDSKDPMMKPESGTKLSGSEGSVRGPREEL